MLYLSTRPMSDKHQYQGEPFGKPTTISPLTLPPLNYETLRFHGRRHHRTQQEASVGPIVPLHNQLDNIRSPAWASLRPATPAGRQPLGNNVEHRAIWQKKRRAMRAALRAALDWDPTAPSLRDPSSLVTVVTEQPCVEGGASDSGASSPVVDVDTANHATMDPTTQPTDDIGGDDVLSSGQSTTTAMGEHTSSLFHRLHRLPPALAPAVLCFL